MPYFKRIKPSAREWRGKRGTSTQPCGTPLQEGRGEDTITKVYPEPMGEVGPEPIKCRACATCTPTAPNKQSERHCPLHQSLQSNIKVQGYHSDQSQYVLFKKKKKRLFKALTLCCGMYQTRMENSTDYLFIQKSHELGN